MPRIKLALPKNFTFSTELRVRVSDVNYGGHLGNDNLLSLIHEARCRFLNQHGFTELNIDGVGTIMVDAVIIFKSEAFQGDLLQIEVAVNNFNKYGFDFFYKITHKESGQEVARAKTGAAFYDYEKRKIARTPKNFIKLCAHKT